MIFSKMEQLHQQHFLQLPFEKLAAKKFCFIKNRILKWFKFDGNYMNNKIIVRKHHRFLKHFAKFCSINFTRRWRKKALQTRLPFINISLEACWPEICSFLPMGTWSTIATTCSLFYISLFDKLYKKAI